MPLLYYSIIPLNCRCNLYTQTCPQSAHWFRPETKQLRESSKNYSKLYYKLNCNTLYNATALISKTSYITLFALIELCLFTFVPLINRTIIPYDA